MVEELRPTSAETVSSEGQHPGAIETQRPEGDEIHYPDGRIEHPRVRHERSDANFHWILGLLLAALVLAVLIHVLIWWYFNSARDHEARLKKSPFPLAPAPSQKLPAEPRLEQLDRLTGAESANIYLRETARVKVIDSYGPTEHEGFIHIPVRRAMTLLENRLPTRAAPPVEQRQREDGLIDAGEANSGRMFRGKPRWTER